MKRMVTILALVIVGGSLMGCGGITDLAAKGLRLEAYVERHAVRRLQTREAMDVEYMKFAKRRCDRLAQAADGLLLQRQGESQNLRAALAALASGDPDSAMDLLTAADPVTDAQLAAADAAAEICYKTKKPGLGVKDLRRDLKRAFDDGPPGEAA